jgi:NADH-quinone oxidoreductase subunit N
MSSHDLYLLSPELSLVGLAALLLLLDLVVARKGVLLVLAVFGLAVPLALSISLWFDLGASGAADNTGILADTLAVDRFALFFKFLFLGVAAAVILVSSDYARRFERFRIEFYALVLFSVTGMMLLASSVELITLYISLELTALPVAALAAFNRDSRSSEAGLKFLILSGISSAVLLYGMVLVYGFTGSTMLDDIAARIGQIGLDEGQPFGSYALLLGIVLMVAGFGFKITAVPFQMWAPDVYEGSPTPITAFLSVASKAAGFAVVLRVFYVAFPMDIVSVEWSAIFAVLAALTMTVGNFVAIAQSNIKRMLAYSTIAHAGYLMVGLAAAAVRAPEDQGALGPSGILFYLGGYAVMNMAAFAAVIAISDRIKSDRIDDYAGMSKRAPYLAGALAFAMVSLTGVPPTVGFMVKIYLFGAAVNHDLAWLAVFGVVNSVVSAYYYLRVIRVMYLSPAPTEERLTSGLPLRLAILVTTAAVLFFGLYPTPLLELARTAAEVLVTVS